MAADPDIIRFDQFALDRANRRLLRDGSPVELGSRYFDALVLLLQADGALVSKDRFMDEVWRGVPVTDEALTQCIRTLRRALDDDASSPRFIQTVPKHGYRFVGTFHDAAPEAEPETRASPASRIAGAATIAGLGAGVLAGLAYGAIAGTGGGVRVLILAAMIGALGTLAGAGLGLGMAAVLAWRGRADALLVGGAGLAGLVVGALGSVLGREGVAMLAGNLRGDVTGPFEGLAIGLASGVAAWLALSGRARPLVLGGALVAGVLAGAVIHFGRGSLLAETLWVLQQELPAMQLAMERLGALAGSETFSGIAQGVTSLIEAATFTLAMALAALWARRD